MHKIREKLMKELKTYEQGNVDMSTLKEIHLLTDTIKNIDKIEMIEEAESYSYGDRSSRDSSYDGGESYRRGRRYSRDSYADGESMRRGSYDGYSERRGQSYDESTDRVRKSLEKLYKEADHETMRNAIRRCMDEL